MKDVNHSARKSKEFFSVKADGTERSNENRTQTQGKLRPYISSYNIHNINKNEPHIRVCVINDLLKLSDMLRT